MSPNGVAGDPGENGRSTLAVVGGGITVLTTVASTLVFAGFLERTPRNHPYLTFLAILAAALAGFVWMVSTFVPEASRQDIRPGAPQLEVRWRHIVQALASLLLLVGIVVLALAIVSTYSEEEVPAISAEIGDNLTLTASVTGAGLTSRQQVGVRVDGFRRGDPPTGPYVLYEAALGPNTSGALDHRIRLPIASGIYELVRVRATTGEEYGYCPLDRVDDLEPGKRLFRHTGCLVLTLPRLPAAPNVTASWGTEGPTGRSISARVQAENAAHRIAVFVVSRTPRRRLAASVLSPTLGGQVDVSTVTPVPAGHRSVCVLARWLPRAPKHRQLRTPICPPRITASTGWVLLTAPRRRQPASAPQGAAERATAG